MKAIQSMSRPISLEKGNDTIQSGVELKLERFSHLSSQSFGFGSPIGLGYQLRA